MTTLDRNTKGVYLIAVTPFADDGALDLASTDRMVDFYLEGNRIFKRHRTAQERA